MLYLEVALGESPVIVPLLSWLKLGWIDLDLCLSFDSLTVSMLLPVLGISSMVHLYSVGYMEGDPHNQRFFSYLSLFTFFMLVLVTAEN